MRSVQHREAGAAHLLDGACHHAVLLRAGQRSDVVLREALDAQADAVDAPFAADGHPQSRVCNPAGMLSSSNTEVDGEVVSRPRKAVANRRGCRPGRAGVGRNPAKKAWWAA